ncbi:hypothetical protein DPMN_036190 [Dreissena polymorpha]|uniref:Uncharacterized protein n=1 Tax=Dreissena polymorpha TaxID=45954 RepID=A0A9D4MD70_DREPO|nr:hypothetical protein DPMN_036190 [Dreissena polymorpha]
MSQNKIQLSASVKEKPTTTLSNQPFTDADIHTEARQVKDNKAHLDHLSGDKKHTKLDAEFGWFNKEIKDTKNDFNSVKEVTKGQDTKNQTEPALNKSNLAKHDAKLGTFNKENKPVELKNDKNTEKGDTKGQQAKYQATSSQDMKGVNLEKPNDSDDYNHAADLIRSSLLGHRNRQQQMSRRHDDDDDDYETDNEDYNNCVALIQSAMKGHNTRKNNMRDYAFSSTGEEDDEDEVMSSASRLRASSRSSRPQSPAAHRQRPQSPAPHGQRPQSGRSRTSLSGSVKSTGSSSGRQQYSSSHVGHDDDDDDF